MKSICNKLGKEDQHMFYQVIEKNIFFNKNLLDIYFETKPIVKSRYQKLFTFWKNYLTSTLKPKACSEK
jgi:hypothetical protein